MKSLFTYLESRLKRDGVIVLAIVFGGACASPPSNVPARLTSAEPNQVPGHAPSGLFVQPSAGTSLIFCSSPGLSVTLKVDSVSTGGSRLAMGTAEIAVGTSNAGTHPDVDEVNYFLDGQGRAFIGVDTIDVRPGLVMYVPQGVRHGFINTGVGPLRFAWTIAPQALANGFRARGVAPGTPCKPL